jgi:hypothetical protein
VSARGNEPQRTGARRLRVCFLFSMTVIINTAAVLLYTHRANENSEASFFFFFLSLGRSSGASLAPSSPKRPDSSPSFQRYKSREARRGLL